MWRTLGFAGLAILVVGAALLETRANNRERDSRVRWPPVGQFVDVSGQRVHYVQSGTGPDVVLIHGASGNLRDFTFDLIRRLESDYRVTAFDRPGHGYSERAQTYRGAFNPRAETPQDQAALLSQAATALGITQPVVVGHSYGGSVAMAWGLDHNAAAVVSLAGAIMPWPGPLDLQYRVLRSRIGGAIVPSFATAFIDPEGAARFLTPIFAPQPAPDGYLAHVGAGLSLRRESLRANGQQVGVLRKSVRAMSSRYETLNVPVELVHGDADTIVGLDIHSKGAAALLPDANVTILAGVGHMPHHAQPQAAIAAIHAAALRAGLL